VVSGREPHPDRERWPAYWRAIRTVAIWLVIAVVVVGGGTTILRPADDLGGIAVRFAIGVVAALVSTVLARLVNDRWDRRRKPA
jgi:hypothetical protein